MHLFIYLCEDYCEYFFIRNDRHVSRNKKYFKYFIRPNEEKNYFVKIRRIITSSIILHYVEKIKVGSRQ